MVKSEKGSVTLIVLATIIFIFIVLATNLVYISAKRKSQLQETRILQNAYDTGISETYYSQVEKINAATQIFEYTGKAQTYTVTISGTYLLEVYGAQGGNASLTKTAGGTEKSEGIKGGYARGTIKLEKGQTLYVYVGGQGKDSTTNGETLNGGFNGGGNVTANSQTEQACASGGGATHISKKNGEFSTQQSSSNDLLIVAGGGAGGHCGTSSAGGTGGGSNNTNGLGNSSSRTEVRSGNGYAKISLNE